MHGPGYAPPPPHRPSQGGLITLRVLFVAMAVLSCGFAAWACMLRLAVVTHRRRDWTLFVLSLAHIVVVLYILASDPGADEFTTWRGDVGMSLLLGGMVVTIAFYLYAEITHFARLARAPYGHPHPHGPHAGTTVIGRQGMGYGFPAPQPQAPRPQPYIPAPPVQPPVPPQPQPQQQRPEPARIDQVRAELDELSDYLRRQEGDK